LPLVSGCDNLPLATWQGSCDRFAHVRTDLRNSLIDQRIRALHLALESRHPRLMEPKPGIARASVSLVIRSAPDGLEVLLIERSRSSTDPWSGHMALPGGRWEPEESALDAAVRETWEEVGIDLLQDGMQIGRLDDVKPSRGGPQIAVSPFVFVVSDRTEPMPNEREVASTVWIPLDHLASPASAAEHLHVLPGGTRLRFPAIAYHRHVIWGLTYRMLIQFLGVARSIKQGEGS